MLALSLLVSLLASAAVAVANTVSGGGTVASAGSSLASNNPIMLPFVLCASLYASLVGGQATGGLVNVNEQFDEYSDDYENTIANGVLLDDDDNDFRTNGVADEFDTSPQSFIQFEPRTYASIVGVAIVVTLLGLWASFDLTGGRLTAERLAAIRARVNAGGGFLPYLIWVSPFILSGLLLVLQLAFLVIATIYIVQPMLQWAVLENPNGTQVVIAQEGLFAVVAPAGAATLAVTALPVVRTNFPPFFFPISGLGAFPTATGVPLVVPGAELVKSPTPINVRNTWYVYVVFLVLLAQFFIALGNALIWRGGQYIAGATAIFAGWGLDIALLVVIALELGDLNPGQGSGEEIAMLVYAIVAVVLLIVVLAFAIGIATVLRQGEYAAILGMNDQELAQITPTEKRRLN